MGEFNVNKSDGSLEQTAGMPSEYPATQVMMSDGVTSVEDALDGLNKKVKHDLVTGITNNNANISALGKTTADSVVYGAYASSMVCLPFVVSGQWFIKVLATDMTPLANTSVSIGITYEEL